MNSNNWISIYKEKPPVGIDVLVLLDYTPYSEKHGKRIEIAKTYYAEFERPYGGPNSLTGEGKLVGLYFAIPAVLKPGVVSHWQHLPEKI